MGIDLCDGGVRLKKENELDIIEIFQVIVEGVLLVLLYLPHSRVILSDAVDNISYHTPVITGQTHLTNDWIRKGQKNR